MSLYLDAISTKNLTRNRAKIHNIQPSRKVPNISKITSNIQDLISTNINAIDINTVINDLYTDLAINNMDHHTIEEKYKYLLSYSSYISLKSYKYIVEIQKLINRPNAHFEIIRSEMSETWKHVKQTGGESIDSSDMKNSIETNSIKNPNNIQIKEIGADYIKSKFAFFCSNYLTDPIPDSIHDSHCQKIHFRKIIKPWTNLELGDCSYVDTCRNLSTCPYLHYELDLTREQRNFLTKNNALLNKSDRSIADRVTRRFNAKYDESEDSKIYLKRKRRSVYSDYSFPPQYINCDVRSFNFSMLKSANIGVIMADPPWDIHMDLPYGTMKDEEMKQMGIGHVHDDGLIFLWVTARAMELARQCLSIWGYERVEEIIWAKTNQIQRLIRTGRTGHWINHSKEHCLVGAKGDALYELRNGLNRLNKYNFNLDGDVLVSEVRETSRKPDEIYALIDRICPGQLKLEIFGRKHNRHRNWVTLGNQLGGSLISFPPLMRSFEKLKDANCLENNYVESNCEV